MATKQHYWINYCKRQLLEIFTDVIITEMFTIFTARAYARAVLGVVILSVCLSVCLSHACIVAKLNDALQIF